MVEKFASFNYGFSSKVQHFTKIQNESTMQQQKPHSETTKCDG